jgi:hypothetical protein
MTAIAMSSPSRSRLRRRRIVLTVGPATFTFTAQVRTRAERPVASHRDRERLEAAHRQTRLRVDEMLLTGRRIP